MVYCKPWVLSNSNLHAVLSTELTYSPRQAQSCPARSRAHRLPWDLGDQTSISRGTCFLHARVREHHQSPEFMLCRDRGRRPPSRTCDPLHNVRRPPGFTVSAWSAECACLASVHGWRLESIPWQQLTLYCSTRTIFQLLIMDRFHFCRCCPCYSQLGLKKIFILA